MKVAPVETAWYPWYLPTPWCQLLKLKCDELHSSVAFKFNLRHYIMGNLEVDVAGADMGGGGKSGMFKAMVRWCKL